MAVISTHSMYCRLGNLLAVLRSLMGLYILLAIYHFQFLGVNALMGLNDSLI